MNLSSAPRLFRLAWIRLILAVALCWPVLAPTPIEAASRRPPPTIKQSFNSAARRPPSGRPPSLRPTFNRAAGLRPTNAFNRSAGARQAIKGNASPGSLKNVFRSKASPRPKTTLADFRLAAKSITGAQPSTAKAASTARPYQHAPKAMHILRPSGAMAQAQDRITFNHRQQLASAGANPRPPSNTPTEKLKSLKEAFSDAAKKE